MTNYLLTLLQIATPALIAAVASIAAIKISNRITSRNSEKEEEKADKDKIESLIIERNQLLFDSQNEFIQSERAFLSEGNRDLINNLYKEIDSLKEQNLKYTEKIEEQSDYIVKLLSEINGIRIQLNNLEIDLREWHAGLRTPPGYLLTKQGELDEQ